MRSKRGKNIAMGVSDPLALPHEEGSPLEITEQDETQEEDASRGETGLTFQEFESWGLQQEFKLKKLEIRTRAEVEARERQMAMGQEKRQMEYQLELKKIRIGISK